MRALVVGLRSEQGSEASGVTGRHFLELAAERLERGRVRLVVVGGLPGAGKSKLSAEVGRAIGAAVLNSDVIRKRLAGVEPSKPAAAGFCEGIYSAEMTAATYSDLFERARARLSLGESVVLDATFADPERRAAARSLALETASDLDEFQCVAPLEVMEGRLTERASRGERVSDADVAVLRELVRRRVPWAGACGWTRRRRATSAAVAGATRSIFLRVACRKTEQRPPRARASQRGASRHQARPGRVHERLPSPRRALARLLAPDASGTRGDRRRQPDPLRRPRKPPSARP